MIDSVKREALELATILDTMADGVFVVDKERKVLRWNRTMERITGYSVEEVTGRDCDFLRTDRADGQDVPLVAADCDPIAQGIVDKAEVFIQRKDGMAIAVIASARRMKDERGETMGAVVTFTDISSIKRLQHEVTKLRQEVEERYMFHTSGEGGIVGRSHKMQEVFNLIDMAAASPVTVLVQGETGTGKELVAKAIHYHSERVSGPLVTVNCSALSESLLESELFGHVRGSFTGAIRDHVGRFERANGGTIFLDEIGEIPPLVQVKLLRVLQEREFERVGESIPRKTDVRVIAATNRDLRARVKEGEFREDLFYRLKVFPIHIPPLRERKEDIDLLVKEFIRIFNSRMGKQLQGLTPDAVRIIMDYCWPGNVRELENAIEHAFVTCSGPLINPFDLPIEIRRVELQRQVREDVPLTSLEYRPPAIGRPRRRPASQGELERLLDECGWNKAEVARRLGITRTSVWRRMKKLGLPLEPEEERQTST